MKKLYVSAAIASLVLASATFAFGGGKHHGGHGHHEMKQLMLESILELSDEQKAEIKAIRREFRGEKKRKRQPDAVRMELFSLDPSSADYQEKIQSIAKQRAEKVEQRILRRGQMHAEMFAILTPEQQDKFRELHKEMHERISQ